MAYFSVPSTAPMKTLSEIQFGVLSPSEIEKMSVGEVTTAELGQRSLEPGGLMDRRQGPSDERMKCATCDGTMAECPGHFGHIKLERPVFHPGFQAVILAVLRSVCCQCFKILGCPNKPEFMDALNPKLYPNPKSRLRAVSDACRKEKVCNLIPGVRHGCQSRQPIYKMDGSKLTATFPAEKQSNKKNDKLDDDDDAKAKVETQPSAPRHLSPEAVYEALKQISDEDCRKLGLDPVHARPEWMIISVLPVAPPAVRPTTTMGGSSRGHDDLTVFYSNIVKANARLKEATENGEHVIEEFGKLLQHFVSCMIDNNRPGQPQQTSKGRPLKALSARIETKEGRVRNNLMGKRCDFSARTVITPDPNISIDQVGVPYSVARNLTFPEMVTQYNSTHLQTLVKNGPNTYPGAKYIIQGNGRRIDLRFQRQGEVQLEVGDIVERHIVDGDVVIFNRQPSLHKMSMMGHRIRVFPYSTFRLNLSVTTPYNADFDGDEMNLHVPQSHETRAEITQLMMVPRNIISPQGNRPCMGIVQDTLLGCSLFTRRDTFLEKDLMMNTLMWLEGFSLNAIPIPAILKPKQLWTGKQIFSLFIPDRINLKAQSTDHDKDDKGMTAKFDTLVYISRGRLLTGILDKRTLGSSATGGLIHVMINEIGTEAARLFIDSTQKVVNYWLLQHGFSVGLGDTIVSRTEQDLIRGVLNRASKAVHVIVKQTQQGELQSRPGRTLFQSFEKQVNDELNRAISEAGKGVKGSLKRNNFKTMVSAGSKGSDLNISQIMACVGQQNVDGARIPDGFSQRTLPHFTKDDYGQESRGFVANSYRQGLTPQEFYFHAMGGRVGLIDTAVKTSETGYIQRRLVKAMEDVRISYDGTVRNAQGQIIQFIYGEDGLDGCKIEWDHLETLTISNNEMEDKYRWQIENPAFGTTFLDISILDNIRRSIDIQHKLQAEWERLRADRILLRSIFPSGEASVCLPVHLHRLIWNAQNIYSTEWGKHSTLDPAYVIDKVDAFCNELHIGGIGDDRHYATQLFEIHIRATLASLRVAREFRLTKDAFNWILGETRKRFHSAIVQPGESVGAIAAQSIGEPATQMTLNTFHLAGVASTLTVGVPRLKELINVAHNLKTPSSAVRLDSTHSANELANKIRNQLAYTTLRQIARATEIWYDPCFDFRNQYTKTSIKEDADWLGLWLSVEEEQVDCRYSPWLLRLILEPKVVHEKHLSMFEIVNCIKKTMTSEEEEQQGARALLWVANSDDNYVDENGQLCLVIHIRIIENFEPSEGDASVNDEEYLKLEEYLLDNVVLLGEKKLKAIFLRQDDEYVIIDPIDGSMHKLPRDSAPWILDTEGVNLRHILSTPGVDSVRSSCNDINEVLKVLGIEAARAALFHELQSVMKFAGASVNYRHIALLTDVMTFRGILAPITRFGINRSDNSPLARCSFEETVEILLEAAQFAENEPLKSVSGNIMLGQMGKFGTGSFDLLVDEPLLQKAVEAPIDLWPSFPGEIFGPATPSAPQTPWSGMGVPQTPLYTDIGTPNYGSPSGFSYSSPSSYPMSPGMPRRGYVPMSPTASISPTSPTYSPRSSHGSPSSPAFSPSSPAFSPSSPAFSPSSPAFSPTSPAFSPTSPAFSPTSPAFSPTSPAFSPTSPAFSPTSPAFSPTSPAFSPTSPAFSPRAYSPTSPATSPFNPHYSPTSPSYAYSPTSPAAYSPSTSPSYSPTSPQHQ